MEVTRGSDDSCTRGPSNSWLCKCHETQRATMLLSWLRNLISIVALVWDLVRILTDPTANLA